MATSQSPGARGTARASQHEYGDMAYPIDSQFGSNAGGLFTLHGLTICRSSALLSAGVGVQWNECVSTYVYYNWAATITPATTSTADCGPVSEKSVPQASLAIRVDKGNSSRNSMTQDHKGLKDVYETIHSDNCYSPAVILVRCVRAIEKPRGKYVGW